MATMSSGSILLPKSSDSHLSSFDYSQWQRSAKQSLTNGQNPQPAQRYPAVTGSNSRHAFTVGRSSSSNEKKVGKKGKRGGSGEHKVTHSSKLLEILVATKNDTLSQYNTRFQQLLLENLKLRSVIEGDEQETHNKVKALLRKYERLRGGVSTMSCNTAAQLVRMKADIRSARNLLDAQLTALQEAVEKADRDLLELQSELLFLINYKDKEYPMKYLQISELKKELNRVIHDNEEDEQKLETIVTRELLKLSDDKEARHRTVTKTATTTTLSRLHPSLREMALQNVVIQKEIEFHEREVIAVTAESRDVEAALTLLQGAPRPHRRPTIDPLQTRGKCSPDDDVILDIPVREWLPI